MQSKIIGRHREKQLLDKALCSKEAEFIAVYGRRRVGKTFLIRNYFRDKAITLFQITGIHNANLQTQLGEFTKELEALYAQLGIKVPLKDPSSWLEAFEALTSAIQLSKQKVVLFFDEFPWLATQKAKLLQALDYYWNRYWSDLSKIKLIICGSAASWIIENILNDRGGLHNRVTLRLPIEPFNLKETQDYLKSQGAHLEQSQILQLYMCIGGIPYYLKFIQPGLSVTQNINEMCFNKQGPLSTEFNNLFKSLFRHAQMHENIVKLLASRRNGLSRSIIEQALEYKGGNLTKLLKELEHAGFIESFMPWGRERGSYYKLVDEYSLFYLNWIAPNTKAVRLKEINSGFWESASQSPAWKAWSGYAFEAICFKHLPQIRKALNIPTNATATTWRYTAKKTDLLPGAQIDLLFDRDDGIVNLCEIKYSTQPFKIDKDYAQRLGSKLEVYKAISKTHKQVSLSMITTRGLESSTYLEGLVWSDACADSFFHEIN